MILFFLATGQIMNSSPVKTRLAVTEDLPTDTLPTPLLEVTEGGALNIDGEPVEGEQIAAALSGETAVHVLIAGETPAQELVALLARPELAAFEIRLVTIADRSDQ